MKKKILWVVSVVLFLAALGAFVSNIFSGLFVLVAAIGCNPVFLQFLEKKGKKPKGIVLAPVVVLFLFIGVELSPSTAGTEDAALAQTEQQSFETAQESTAEEPDEEDVKKDLDEKEFQQKAADVSELQDEESEEKVPDESELSVHFIDVGQGDSTLIVCNDEAMLIDAGDNNQGTKVQNYLQKQGVDNLKYVIGTHPDADHIGGLDVILYKFNCETVMIPNEEKDSDTYRDVIDTMETKGYKNTQPVVGDTYLLGDAEFTVLSPCCSYSDSNNNSVAILFTHGKNRFLFSGDAEEEAEKDMLQSEQSLGADVYKVGHHGSRTSSSLAYLQAISPAYAVISCGEGNTYGHPHAEVLNNLRAMKTQVFRTDEQGTVIVNSDGEKLTWNCSPSESWQAGEPTGSETATKEEKKDIADSAQEPAIQQETKDTQEIQEPQKTPEPDTAVQATEGISYVCNTNTMKFHYPGCHSVDKIKDKNRLDVTATREELIGQGYAPCGNCKP